MLLNIRNYINTVLLTDYVFPNDIEAFFIEIKVNTYSWLICYSYNPNTINVSTIYSKKYQNILILMGDYNVYVKGANIIVFCNQYKEQALHKEPTYFKIFNNLSCIDLFLTNSSKSFEKYVTLEIDLSQFHKLMIIIMVVKPDKLPPRIIKYSDYKKFDSEVFNNKFQVSLKNFNINNSSFIKLKKIFMKVLNKAAPRKTNTEELFILNL